MAEKKATEQPLLAAVKEPGDDGEFGASSPHISLMGAVSALRGVVLVLGVLTLVAAVISWPGPLLPVGCRGLECAQSIVNSWRDGLAVQQPVVTFNQVEGTGEGSQAEEGNVAEAYLQVAIAERGDYAELELRRTQVPAETLSLVLQQGERAEAADEEVAPFLVAEIENKSDDILQTDEVHTIVEHVSQAVKSLWPGNEQVRELVEAALEGKPEQGGWPITVGETVAKVGKGEINGLDYLGSLMQDENGPTTVIKAAPGVGRRIYIREYIPGSAKESVEESAVTKIVKMSNGKVVVGDGEDLQVHQSDLAQAGMEVVLQAVNSVKPGVGTSEDLAVTPGKDEDEGEDLADDDDAEEEAGGRGGGEEGMRGKDGESQDVPWVIRRIPGWTQRPTRVVPLDEDEPAIRMHLRSRKIGMEH